MGCSASRPGPSGKGEMGFGGPGMAPLRRRIDDIKRRKRMNSSGRLSTKELLTDDDGMSIAGSKRLPEDFDKEESQFKEPEMNEQEKEASGDSKEKRVSGSSSDAKKVTGGESDEKKAPSASDEKRDDEKDVKGEEEEVVELGFGDVPSSPSFREYFKSADNLENGDSGKVKGGKEGKDIRTVERRKDSSDSNEVTTIPISIETGNVVVEQELEEKTTKKGGRLRVFKKGKGAVYSSLSFKSCYNASTTDSPRHLNEKAD